MDLAIFGAPPRFAKPQPVGFPLVEPETVRRFHRLVDRAFLRNYLTNDGPLVRRLEEEIAALHGSRRAVFMANGTLAQLMILKAMGLESGSVLVSANTFIATAHACEWSGLEPVFCDIDAGSLNLDPEEIRRRHRPDVRAVIPTHVFGVVADMRGIAPLARERNIAVVADAAHAFDCDRNGTRPGGFGVPEFLSFHATKFFSTFEGGAVLTDDAALDAALRDLRNFGFAGVDDVRALGINAKGSEAAAAFGLASLPALPARRERLRQVHDLYARELAGVPGLRVHNLNQAGRVNYRYFAVFIEPEFGVGRDAVAAALWQDNVLARKYFYPGCHRMAPYRGRPGGGAELPVAERALDSILCLPTSFDGVGWRDGAGAVSGLLKKMRDRAERVASWHRSLVP